MRPLSDNCRTRDASLCMAGKKASLPVGEYFAGVAVLPSLMHTSSHPCAVLSCRSSPFIMLFRKTFRLKCFSVSIFIPNFALVVSGLHELIFICSDSDSNCDLERRNTSNPITVWRCVYSVDFFISYRGCRRPESDMR